MSEMPIATSAYTMPIDRPTMTRSRKYDMVRSFSVLRRRSKRHLPVAIGDGPAEIRQPDGVVADHLLRRALDVNDAVLDHVAVFGEQQRHPHVLLDHQQRHAVAADAADRAEDVEHDLRGERGARLV